MVHCVYFQKKKKANKLNTIPQISAQWKGGARRKTKKRMFVQGNVKSNHR